MKFQYLTALYLLASSMVLADRAGAGSPDDVRDCIGNLNPDRQIAACRALLASGKLPTLGQYSAHLNIGNGFAEKLDLDSAIEEYSKAIKLNPSAPGGWGNRGGIRQEVGDLDGAMADEQQALRLDPNFANAYLEIGLIWSSRKHYDDAIAYFDKCLQIDPNQVNAYRDRGRVWAIKGDYDRAIADYNSGIRIAPKFAPLYSLRGEAWRLKGDLDNALADQNRAVQLADSQNKNTGLIEYLSRGDTLRYMGQLDRAMADYDHTLTIRPDYIGAFIARGLTFEKMGDLARAREEFQKALDSKFPWKPDSEIELTMETARAHLAALDAGAVPPKILPVPPRTKSETSIPTPAVTVPSVVPILNAHDRRIALVIGNSAYQNVAPLHNPQHDADVVAAALRAVGFDTVTVANNATHQATIDALRAFADAAERADWAMVYYAGHGIEVNGINYLIPVDAKLAVDRDVQFEAIPLDQIMTALEGTKKLKLILLDACRNNPFLTQMRHTAVPDIAPITSSENSTPRATVRSIGPGLAEIQVSGATLVVYAAKGGSVALDGEGDDSPFAVAVVQRIATPGVEINKIFRLVRDDVMEATAGRQEPYTYGSLPGSEDFYFVQK